MNSNIISGISDPRIDSVLSKLFGNDAKLSIGDISDHLVLIKGPEEIKGSIVDLVRQKVVCPPSGRIDSVISDHLPIKNGMMHLVDDRFEDHFFDLKECVIEDGHEGTIVRVWYDQTADKTKYSTKGKINSEKSCWVVTKYFFDMYLELNGPTNLFDTLKADRNLVFYFLMVHPEVQVVSSENIGHGRLIYLGLETTRKEEDSRKEEDYSHYLAFIGDDKTDPYPEIPCMPSKSKEFQTHQRSHLIADLELNFPRDQPLTVEEANQRLCGPKDCKDYRIDGTNFIVITQGQIRVKVMTPGYAWRFKLRDNQPNLAYMWYNLVTDSYVSGRMALSDQDYLKKYPQLKPVDTAIVKRRVDLGQDLKFDLMRSENQRFSPSAAQASVDSRLHNIFQVTILSIPPAQRSQLLEVYQEFFHQRTEVVDWLYSLYLSPKLKPESEGNSEMENPRISKILEDVVNYAKQIQGSRLDKTGGSFNMLVLNNIKNLIAKEAGKSLYRLVRSSRNNQEVKV